MEKLGNLVDKVLSRKLNPQFQSSVFSVPGVKAVFRESKSDYCRLKVSSVRLST